MTMFKPGLNLLAPLMLGRPAARIRALVALTQRGGKLATLAMRRLERYGMYVSKNARIGPGLELPHPTAIVIGDGVKVGRDVTLYQSVTLGGRVPGDWARGNYPTISDGCTLFAGVVVAGRVHIGKNCIIGANAVVISDIPDNAVAVGAPARVVKIKDAD
jgi:serine O-acetyltransferase